MIACATTDLPEPDFADQGDGAARPDPERDAAHRLDDTFGDAEFDMQIADVQQVGHWASVVEVSRGERSGREAVREAGGLAFHVDAERQEVADGRVCHADPLGARATPATRSTISSKPSSVDSILTVSPAPVPSV